MEAVKKRVVPPVGEAAKISMIDKKSVEEFIAGKLEGTDYFPVEVKVSGDNEIKIEIDSMGSVDIDFCV